MAEPTVAAGYAKALAAFAVSRGADAKVLTARAGIAADGLVDPDARIPFTRFRALMRAAKDLTGDDALALHFGAATPLVDMSIVGLIAHASATMGEAFEQTNRFARLVIEVDGHRSGPRFAIVRRADGVWIEDRRRNPNDFPELTESTWSRFVGEVARNFKNRPYVLAVHVTHPAPPYEDEYQRLLKAPVTFGSDRNALRIDPSWLDIRLAPANRYAFGVFSERAEALLKSLEAATTVRGRVEALLIPVLHTGDPAMQRIARSMGVSRPTLYRHLKAEGISFDSLLDDLRHRMARHYLEGKKVSIAEAAYLTGFSDAGAFSRAYKRWTGNRPGRRRSA
jgi:AraC-like DNA-binding protein